MFPDTAIYTCGAGYTFVGSAARVAQVDGSYLGAPPTCVDMCAKGNAEAAIGLPLDEKGESGLDLSACALSSLSPADKNCTVVGCASGYAPAESDASAVVSCDDTSAWSVANLVPALSYHGALRCIKDPSDICATVSSPPLLAAVAGVPSVADLSGCALTGTFSFCKVTQCIEGYATSKAGSVIACRFDAATKMPVLTYSGALQCDCGLGAGPCRDPERCAFRPAGTPCHAEGSVDAFGGRCDAEGVCGGDVNACESSPCLHGGDCASLPAGEQLHEAGFSCVCGQGWIGKKCEEEARTWHSLELITEVTGAPCEQVVSTPASRSQFVSWYAYNRALEMLGGIGDASIAVSGMRCEGAAPAPGIRIESRLLCSYGLGSGQNSLTLSGEACAAVLARASAQLQDGGRVTFSADSHPPDSSRPESGLRLRSRRRSGGGSGIVHNVSTHSAALAPRAVVQCQLSNW